LFARELLTAFNKEPSAVKTIQNISLPGWRIVAFLFLVAFTSPPASASFQLQLISQFSPSFVYPAGGGGDAVLPTISPDGRFVLFASTANNLVLTTNGTPIPALVPSSLNVYLRDRASNTTTLVSVNLAGTGGGNGDSLPVSVSTNGQYVLFESAASDLVPGDTNGASDIFVRDLVNGVTFLISANTNGVGGNGASHNAVMTPDGDYVAFSSLASDLVADDTNGIPDIFLRDLHAKTTKLISAGALSPPLNISTLVSQSETPAITTDGRYVAFFSTAIGLVPSAPPGEVYIRDQVAGVTTWASTNARAIAKSLTGLGGANFNVVSCNLSISTNGDFVVFEVCTNSSTPAFAPGIILRYQRQTGLTDVVHTNALTPLTSFENMHNLDMTPDGRFIAFVANATGFSGTNIAIFLWDAQTGTNTPVSVDPGNNLPSTAFCDSPAVSADGQFVAFLSDATNLTTNFLTGDYHLYLRNMQAGTTVLVDADTNGVGAGVAPTAFPSLSADGQWVAFESSSPNLVANDNDGDFDVFLANPSASASELVSAPHPALPGGGPTISWSAATNKTYSAQWQSDLSGANWLNVTGTVTIVGKHGYVTDFAPAPNQRFYRGVSN
jgi:Tol biopolymer transport system component